MTSFYHPPHAQSVGSTVPCPWQPIKLQQVPSAELSTIPFLTPNSGYGVYCHMPKAKLVFHTRYVDEQGGLVEMKAYDVPRTPSTPHGFKYSLVYILKGQRLVGYDNHEHKGDHRHFAPPRLLTSLRSLTA